MNKNDLTIYGIYPVVEAIKSGKEINKVYILKTLNNDSIKRLITNLKEAKINFQFVPIQKLDKFAEKNHQGVVAVISPIKYFDLAEILEKNENNSTVNLLMLDNITDVRNFGAIARTAECMGIDAIILPKHNSVQINSDAIKTSAGALNKIPVCREENLLDSLYLAHQYGYQSISCSEKTEIIINDIDYSVFNKKIIIMGSEEKGINKNLLKNSKSIVKIPMRGTIDSLNVSVACGIALFEII